MVLLCGEGQGVFQIMLDVHIQGKLEGVARLGLHQGIVAFRHIIAPGVLGGHHPAVLPFEQVVIFQFQAGHPVPVHIGEAQDRAGKIPLGVYPLGIFQNADALPAMFQHRLLHLVSHLLFHLAAKQTVVGGALVQFFQHLTFFQFQDFGQHPGRLADILLGHLPGHGPDGPAGNAGGQHHPVPVHNIPPWGGHHRISQLLVLGTARIEIVIPDLQDVQPPHQGGKADQSHAGAQQPDPPALAGILRTLYFAHKNTPCPYSFMHGQGALFILSGPAEGQKGHSIPFSAAYSSISSRSRKGVLTPWRSR